MVIDTVPLLQLEVATRVESGWSDQQIDARLGRGTWIDHGAIFFPLPWRIVAVARSKSRSHTFRLTSSNRSIPVE